MESLVHWNHCLQGWLLCKHSITIHFDQHSSFSSWRSTRTTVLISIFSIRAIWRGQNKFCVAVLHQIVVFILWWWLHSSLGFLWGRTLRFCSYRYDLIYLGKVLNTNAFTWLHIDLSSSFSCFSSLIVPHTLKELFKTVVNSFSGFLECHFHSGYCRYYWYRYQYWHSFLGALTAPCSCWEAQNRIS